MIKVVLNFRFSASIAFQDVLHGLRAGRGTDTASLGAKMFHPLTFMMEEVLYAIFLGLHKECYALDRDIFLGILDIMEIIYIMAILEWYGVVPWYCCVFRTYWERQYMLAFTVGYYRASFQDFPGVNQG